MQTLRRMMLAAAGMIIILLMTGCWDNAEINGRAFVLGFGADRENDTDESCDFTFQLAIPVSGESDSSGSIEYAGLTVKEATPAAAVRRLEKNLGREINFEQLSLIVIGEQLSHESFTGLTDYFFRRASVRRQSCIAVCDGAARDFFSAPSAGRAVSAEAASILQSYDSGRGNISMDLFSLYKKLINRDCFFLPKIAQLHAGTTVGSSEGRNSPALGISGAVAYAQNGRYCGELNEEDLELLRLTCGSGAGGALAVYDNQGGRYCCEVRQSECSVRCRISGGVPAFRLKLGLVLVPLDAGGIDGGGYSPEALKQLSQNAERTVKGRLEALAQKSRTALGSSVFGLQDVIRQRQPDWYGLHGEEWDSIYPESEITVTVNCTVAGGGITK